MFYQQLSKREKEDKLHRIIKLKDEIEEGRGPRGNKESKKMIAAWKAFIKLPYTEQSRQRAEWKQYYEECRKTISYDIYQECKEALRKNNMTRLRALLTELREMQINEALNSLPKPRTTDPWEFERGWVKAYQECEIIIRDLKRELDVPEVEEAAKIWSQE